MQSVFFSEMLQDHEVAHQWWGNIVGATGEESEWLLEALANYSSVLLLEKRNGARSLETVMSGFRDNLLTKNAEGQALETAGPIVWGYRLESSQYPSAWKVIAYEKGSWILHMLRRRLGDEQFLKMLGEVRKRFEYRTISTDQFREVASSFLPKNAPDPKLQGFFQTWVYGTGIPSLKVTWSVKGKAPALRLTATITQTQVSEEFTALVPVEIHSPAGRPVTHWVDVSSEPGHLSIPVRQRPSKVVIAPGAVLMRD
jgi:aminopeptidase N